MGRTGRMGRRGKPFLSSPSSRSRLSSPEGWHGWDEYAPFYDWENARTLGRRDVGFWRRFAGKIDGRVLELGSGTGRITRPLARAGVDIVGVDRSDQMLSRALRRARSGQARQLLRLVRGDIRYLPFRQESFAAVLAPYGVLQSLTTSRDLTTALKSVARVLPRGGAFGIDLVPDVANWDEYTNQRRFHGLLGAATVTLFESVRRNRRRGLTMFEERYLVQRGRQVREHRFDLVFRTVSMPAMTRLLRRAGFAIAATLGDYRRGPWHPRADVWIILAKKV
jgi:ubiquinone/menaquinone biosynthesis C-methylase UbiE